MVVAKWLEPERSHFPWIMVGVVGIAFCIARVIHHSDPGPELALYMVRAQYAAALLLPVLTLMTIESLGSLPRSRWTIGLWLATLPICAGFVLTPWFVSGPVVPRADLLGQVAYSGAPAVLMWAMIPFGLWLVVLFRRRLRAMPKTLAPLRRTLRIAIVVSLAFGLNDALQGSGVIDSIPLFQYAFLVVSFVAVRVELQRGSIIREQLTAVVEERGRDLDTKRAAIDTALHKLTRSEARYRHLAQATREGVVVFEGRRVIDVNDAFLRMLDMSEEGLLGADAIELFDPVDTLVIEQLVTGSEMGPTDTRIHKLDGSLLAVSVKATRVPEGAPGTRVLLVRDMSGERELRLQLLRADRLAAVGTLAAGTAHEINNPLVYVVGNAEVLQQELERLTPMLPPGELDLAKEVVSEIGVGGERVRRIVKDLMSLARERSTDDSAVDVRRVLESTLTMAANQLKHRATVVREFEDVPAVYASEVRLGQVFLNLIVNAAQAIPEGRVAENQVRVRTRAEGDRVIVEIIDTGVGMDHDTRDRIWDPFFTTKEVGTGTGLGLSISHGIITTIGGSIDVDSEVGKGTTFRVTLPAMPPKPTIETIAKLGSEMTATRRILVVDDEELVARNLARMLSPHRVDVAGSGREALDRCAKDRYDIVLCDLMMPDVTGMEVYSQLVAADPAAAARFVFMTGGVFTDKARDFLDRVATRCLEKPITKADLHRAIADVLTAPSPP
jgi:two-component system, cell cycle sensor histidine kinase and response regulator CckA